MLLKLKILLFLELQHIKFKFRSCSTDSATPHPLLRATFSQGPGEGKLLIPLIFLNFVYCFHQHILSIVVNTFETSIIRHAFSDRDISHYSLCSQLLHKPSPGSWEKVARLRDVRGGGVCIAFYQVCFIEKLKKLIHFT